MIPRRLISRHRLFNNAFNITTYQERYFKQKVNYNDGTTGGNESCFTEEDLNGKRRIIEEKIDLLNQTSDLIKQLFKPDKLRENKAEKNDFPEILKVSSSKIEIDKNDSKFSNPHEHLTRHEISKSGAQTKSNVLYCSSFTLSFCKSDFERLLPSDIKIDFDVVKSRNPKNLTQWFGYYLVFKTADDAEKFKEIVQGSELSGIELTWNFASRNSLGLNSPILEKLPGHPRNRCVLIVGISDQFDKNYLRRVFWDYDFIDDEELSIEYLEKDLIKYGGRPVLLRFNNDSDPYRMVRQYHRNTLPDSKYRLLVETLE